MNTVVYVSLEQTLRSVFFLLRDDACRVKIESIAQSAWHWLFVICARLFIEPEALQLMQISFEEVTSLESHSENN